MRSSESVTTEAKEEMPKVSPPRRDSVQSSQKREELNTSFNKAPKNGPQSNVSAKPGHSGNRYNANNNGSNGYKNNTYYRQAEHNGEKPSKPYLKPEHRLQRAKQESNTPTSCKLTLCFSQNADPAAMVPVAEVKMPVAEVKMPVAEVKMPVAEVKMPVAEVKMPVAEVKMPVAENKLPALRHPKAVVNVKEETLVPTKCLIDLVSIGESLVLSIDNTSKECREERDGYICLSLSLDQTHTIGYSKLCEPYGAECETAAEITPSLGQSFSLLLSDDGAWYRARLLTDDTASLIDAAKLAKVEKGKCRVLTEEYEKLPEYCCLLRAQGVEVGGQYKATIKSRGSDGACAVQLSDMATDAFVAEGEVSRWRPKVDAVAKPEPSAIKNTTNATVVPSVPRPPLTSGALVAILSSCKGVVCVRAASDAAQRAHDMVEEEVALYGRTACPLKEPPSQSDLVVAQFTDGNHYRALCRRTSRAKDKYLLEYVENGKEDITCLAKLYPCPEEFSLAKAPTVCSLVNVGVNLTPQAEEYLVSLQDQEAVLSLPDGASSAPSGSEAILTLKRTNENVNKRVTELCTPDWKKVEQSNKTALETDTEILRLCDMEYLRLPASGQLRIMDGKILEMGCLNVCAQNEEALKTAERVEGELAEKIEAYCNSEWGSEPYLPRNEELCIAKCPPYEQWFRAVRMPNPSPSHSEEVFLLYLDYGNMGPVPMSDVRKMMPEFVRGVPALVSMLEIKGLPDQLSPAAIERARSFLEMDTDSGGVVNVVNCVQSEPGSYVAECPQLIEALKGLI